MSTNTLLLYLLFLVLAVAINGLFVAFEFALVSMRRSRVQELIDNGIGSARTVSRLQHDMDDRLDWRTGYPRTAKQSSLATTSRD